ncbi:MAG: hypothetical protein KGN76_07040 [Acidobacteriota bacterium]|nr:hypothetical protein [Acidobacteriota bacterium]
MTAALLSVLVLLGASPSPARAAPAPPPGTPAVTCVVPHDAAARAFRLQQTKIGWELSMRGTATAGRWISLPLPGASPSFGDGTASLHYRSAYGGRTVTLTVSPAAASLDVYANYELEVNVDPDLDPKIDLLNTNGPIAGLACRVTRP